MNIPLYARMNEFAPAAAAKNAGEDGHHGHHEEEQEAISEHGTLFEQCIPDRGKLNASASEGDFNRLAHSDLSVDVPDLKIGSALAEGNMTDGYKLHDLAMFDSGMSDKYPLAGAATEVAERGFEQGASEKFNVIPQLELDFSSDATTTIAAQRGAVEPSGGRQTAA